MASSYSSDLKLELMVTGEKSNLWGDITNTNLVILQQAIAGYEEISIAGGAQTTALTFSNGITSNGKNAVIKLTGTFTGNQIVTIPDSVEKTYIIHDGCDHAGFTLTFKTSSGTGVDLCEGHSYTLYSDGTNVVKAGELRKWRAISSAETVQPGAQILANTNGGAVTITLPASPVIGDTVNFVDQGYDFNTNALTVGRNGSNIANSAADLVVNTQGAAFGLVYSGDATTGWTYTEK
jgi:hypothetical protein